MDSNECCDHLEEEIDRYVSAFDDAAIELPVPACPGWSVFDLTAHLGEIHRWAEQLVRTRSQRYVAESDMDLDLGPVSASWLREGGACLVATLRASDPDLEMWAWGLDHHVRFWPRRQLHETVVHRCDLELALDRLPSVSAAIAVDGIDEFFVNLAPAARFSPGVRELGGKGERLRFRAADSSAHWVVSLTQGGFTIGRDDDPVDAELRAESHRLLLVLYRRTAPDGGDVEMSGNEDLIRFWLSKSALE